MLIEAVLLYFLMFYKKVVLCLLDTLYLVSEQKNTDTWTLSPSFFPAHIDILWVWFYFFKYLLDKLLKQLNWLNNYWLNYLNSLSISLAFNKTNKTRNINQTVLKTDTWRYFQISIPLLPLHMRVLLVIVLFPKLPLDNKNRFSSSPHSFPFFYLPLIRDLRDPIPIL